MFRQFATLFRGSVHSASEDLINRNALPLLQQQIRDSAHAVAAAKKAVALAMAQNRQEQKQHEVLVDRIEDLETRAVAALEQDQQELAREAAETIAILETERDTSGEAQAAFAKGLKRLKTNVREAERRLRHLQRGERFAVATEKSQRLRQQVPEEGTTYLAEAEDTLKRLQHRQSQIDLTADALDELNVTDDPSRMVKKLADAGCGRPQHTTAESVLERLAKRAKPIPGNA